MKDLWELKDLTKHDHACTPLPDPKTLTLSSLSPELSRSGPGYPEADLSRPEAGLSYPRRAWAISGVLPNGIQHAVFFFFFVITLEPRVE